MPHVASSTWTFCTRAISNLAKPTFGETFPLAVPKKKLVSKTLQITIWAISGTSETREDCLGSAQVSLADFDVETVNIRWYNVLSFHFMQQPSEKNSPGEEMTLKVEKSAQLIACIILFSWTTKAVIKGEVLPCETRQ